MNGHNAFPQLEHWRRVSLDELNERAALLDREERKYLIGIDEFDAVLDDLAGDFDVLAIDDRIVFTYETTYYDTDELVTYQQHAQGKRRRLKIRSRRYIESDLCFFEVKLKGRRGRTIKERIPYDRLRHGTVDREAVGFVDSCVRRHYDTGFTHRLTPMLTMRYQRITLVGTVIPERVTVDLALEFQHGDDQWVVAPDDTAIVEVKSPTGDGQADRVLRTHRCRPVGCSKYCVGLNLTRDDLRYNPFKQTLTNHFEWTPASARHVGRPAELIASRPQTGRRPLAEEVEPW